MAARRTQYYGIQYNCQLEEFRLEADGGCPVIGREVRGGAPVQTIEVLGLKYVVQLFQQFVVYLLLCYMIYDCWLWSYSSTLLSGYEEFDVGLCL